MALSFLHMKAFGLWRHLQYELGSGLYIQLGTLISEMGSGILQLG